MAEIFAENRLMLSFLGGAIGGFLGALIYGFGHRLLPRVIPGALMGVFVLVGAFAGARLGLGFVAPPASSPAEKPPSVATVDPALKGPVPDRVETPTVYPRGQIAPRDVALLAALASRDAAFAARLDGALGTNPAPTRDVLVFAITDGAEAAQAYIPYAEDQTTLDLVESMAVMTARLGERNPQACYGWLYGGYGHVDFDFDGVFEAVGQPLLDYHLAAYADLVLSSGTTNHDIAIEEARQGKIAADRATFAMMQTAGIERSEIITGERAPADSADYRAACQARLALLRTLLADEDAAGGIRYLYGAG